MWPKVGMIRNTDLKSPSPIPPHYNNIYGMGRGNTVFLYFIYFIIFFCWQQQVGKGSCVCKQLPSLEMALAQARLIASKLHTCEPMEILQQHVDKFLPEGPPCQYLTPRALCTHTFPSLTPQSIFFMASNPCPLNKLGYRNGK